MQKNVSNHQCTTCGRGGVFVYRFFYSATLCVSVIFAVDRCLYVSPFVCLSHSLCCFQAAKDIIKISSRPESPVILFLRPSGFTQFQGNPLTKGVKYTRVRKLWFTNEVAVYLVLVLVDNQLTPIWDISHRCWWSSEAEIWKLTLEHINWRTWLRRSSLRGDSR